MYLLFTCVDKGIRVTSWLKWKNLTCTLHVYAVYLYFRVTSLLKHNFWLIARHVNIAQVGLE